MNLLQRWKFFLVPCSLCLVPVMAPAHHSFSMFDRDTEMALTGSVERWAFNNPHAWLYINVENDAGEIIEWGFEGGAPPQLVRQGITGRTFNPGDEVTIMFSPLADGRPGGAMLVKLPDDSYVRPADGGCGSRDPKVLSAGKPGLSRNYVTRKSLPSKID